MAIILVHKGDLRPYDPNRHHRRSVRLHGYDYTQAGAHFITLCLQRRTPCFGTLKNGTVQLNAAGSLVANYWANLPDRFASIVLDASVIMPDHFHAILWLDGGEANTTPLGKIVGAFKSLTVNAYIQGVRLHGWLEFEKRLWQRDYYERIVRDDEELLRFRRYIEENPERAGQ